MHAGQPSSQLEAFSRTEHRGCALTKAGVLRAGGCGSACPRRHRRQWTARRHRPKVERQRLRSPRTARPGKPNALKAGWSWGLGCPERAALKTPPVSLSNEYLALLAAADHYDVVGLGSHATACASAEAL